MNSPTNKRAIPRQATSAVAFSGVAPAADDPLLAFTPVPHARPRRNSITPDVQREFIAHLAATGIVTAAARHVGKSMEALYKLRQRPGAEGFRAAWDAAIDRGVARLEATALTRAIEGEERMVVSSGKLIGTETRHNEALVMFFLRNRLPERYGPKPAETSEDVYQGLLEQAMAAAREWVGKQRRIDLGTYDAVLAHMVENRMAGRAYAHGLDKSKSLLENAELIARKEQETEA